MLRTRRNDDDAFDEDGVLRDGRSFRASMSMMDSLQRDVRAHFGPLLITDTQGGTIGLHRPGFRVDAETAVHAARRQGVIDALDQYEDDLTDAYKNPTGAGSNGPRGAQAGDVCTVRSGAGQYGPEGSAGKLREIDGQLVCCASGYPKKAGNQSTAAAESDAATTDAVEAEYSAYDAALRDAWRNPN